MTITFVTPTNSGVNPLGDGKIIGMGNTLYVLSGAFVATSLSGRYGVFASGTSNVTTSAAVDGTVWGDVAGINLTNSGSGTEMIKVGDSGTIAANGPAIHVRGGGLANLRIHYAGVFTTDGPSGGFCCSTTRPFSLIS